MAQLTSIQHVINVIQGSSTSFVPDVTNAAVGDTVVFNFTAPNQTVVRGEYTKASVCGRNGCDPCMPYEIIHPDECGFRYVNVPADPVSTQQPSLMEVKIVDDSPIWFYSGLQDECVSKGIVGVINPADGSLLAVQKRAAVSEGGSNSTVPASGGNSTSVAGAKNSNGSAPQAAQAKAMALTVLRSKVTAVVVSIVLVFAAIVAIYYAIRALINRRKRRKQARTSDDFRTSLIPDMTEPVPAIRYPSSIYTRASTGLPPFRFSNVSQLTYNTERVNPYANIVSDPYPSRPPTHHSPYMRNGWL